ncbi:uncharacterized protein LOC132871282 [Neoarius graeffei]|uniref:uncharacterized protein LOC132871282 n=1 Tax=Neoarius graeffei TaxID=443677 RepID=UPI00298C1DFA|nr:uncharacterized protein LOC132871282 [Neoarius graeffei]
MPLPPQWSTPAGTGASPHHPSPSPVDPVQASSRALHPIQSTRHLQESLETSFDSVQASSRALHDGQGVSAIAAMFERITEAHMSRLMRRLEARFDRTEARFDKIESLVETNAPTHTPQLQQDDVVLAKPCSMVMELLELDRSLEQPDKWNKMQHFLETVRGAAIHRMLRRAANNEVLAQYSLRGRRAKMSFDDLVLCKIIKGKVQLTAQQLPADSRLNYTDLMRDVLQQVGCSLEQHHQRFQKLTLEEVDFKNRELQHDNTVAIGLQTRTLLSDLEKKRLYPDFKCQFFKDVRAFYEGVLQKTIKIFP